MIIGPKRFHVINAILQSNPTFTQYLEIGVRDPNDCFNKIVCENKVGVDPVSGGTVQMFSDDFFAQNENQFDVIFIDGDHHHEQVFRDIKNGLECLSDDGFIVLHDCFPERLADESSARCGTAWRAFAHYRQDENLEGIVGFFDHGVGIIKKKLNSQPVILPASFDSLNYEQMIEHAQDWMRISDWEQVLAFVK